MGGKHLTVMVVDNVHDVALNLFTEVGQLYRGPHTDLAIVNELQELRDEVGQTDITLYCFIAVTVLHPDLSCSPRVV